MPSSGYGSVVVLLFCCVTNLPVLCNEVCRKAPYEGICSRCALFVASLDREVASYDAQHCSFLFAASLHLFPLNTVLKQSALSTALLQTGTHTRDQESQSTASTLLDPSPMVSVRPVLDLSAWLAVSGVNSAVTDCPLSQSTVHHAWRLCLLTLLYGCHGLFKFFSVPSPSQ